MPVLTLDSPLGPLSVTQGDDAITGLCWGTRAEPLGGDKTPLLIEAARQIDAYFAQDLTRFDLPLHVAGSDTQTRVCDAMFKIPLGETTTYGAIARALSLPAQAVGQACGGNPIPLIIPCHRVLGASGLGGFSGDGGVETKVWLLRFERAGGLLI